MRTTNFLLSTACCTVLTGIALGGCTAPRHDQGHARSSHVAMRTDVVQAAALLRDSQGHLTGIAFLGRRATYHVTRGAAALIAITQSPVASKIWVTQYPWGDKLTLEGLQFHGSIELTASVTPQEKESISALEKLGFEQTLPNYYTRTLHVEGDAGAPVQLPKVKWPHPITIDLWGPEKLKSAPDALKSVALTPIVALGAPLLVGAWVVACFAEPGQCAE